MSGRIPGSRPSGQAPTGLVADALRSGVVERVALAIQPHLRLGSYPGHADAIARKALEASRIAALTEALIEARTAIIEAAQDTLWCSDKYPAETVVDHIDAALAKIGINQ